MHRVLLDKMRQKILKGILRESLVSRSTVQMQLLAASPKLFCFRMRKATSNTSSFSPQPRLKKLTGPVVHFLLEGSCRAVTSKYEVKIQCRCVNIFFASPMHKRCCIQFVQENHNCKCNTHDDLCRFSRFQNMFPCRYMCKILRYCYSRR